MPPKRFNDDDIETRNSDIRVSVGDQRRIRGTAIVFNSLSRPIRMRGVGEFREKILPQAVDRTLRKGDEVFALFNHDWDQVLGNSRSGSLRINKDPQGLSVVIDPPETDYARNVLTLLERGDIRGMSFRFITIDDDWDFSTNPPTRIVRDMEFPEISVVTQPAYEQATAALRSYESAMKACMDPQIIALREKLNAPLPWEKTA